MFTREETEEHKEQRRTLVESIRNKGISDEKVLSAINHVPRQLFMPEKLQEVAYVDKAFPIGHSQTISQPYTVAYQTQLLEIQPDDRILEIGTGSAYQAVILAMLAAEVFTIERQRKLYENLKHFDFLKEFSNLFTFYGDGYEGLPAYAPFDKIIITAAAPSIPQKLVAQLKVGGKMVLPLGTAPVQKMLRLTKKENEEVEKEYFDNFSFVPMLEGTKE